MWLFRSGLFLFAYLGISIYTGLRFLALARYFFPSCKALIFWPLYLLLCCSFVWIMLLRFAWLQPLRQAAMNTFPALVYFFFALLVLDGIRLVLYLVNKTPCSPGFFAAGTGIALCLTVLVMIYGVFHARNISAAHYTLTLNKNRGESSLRITLVSDLHIGRIVGRKWIANIVDVINLTEPDIICIAGDIFDNDIGAVRDLGGIAEELRRLSAPLGVYACPGNHDVDRLSLRQGAAADRIQEFLKNAGVTFLQDEVVLVDGLFYLAGRRDARPIGIREARKSPAELTAGLDKSRPIVFMDHQPIDFPGEEEAGVDLILSGHTHRGQFFPGNIATARIFKEAGAVHYGRWQGRSAQGVVTSGAGVWGPPIRIATRSEVAVINIVFGD